MKKPSFETLKKNLEAACEFLRSFTLARRGFTPKHGIQAIERVLAQCDRMDKLFGTGSKAAQTKALVALARSKVLAAKARLAVLGVAS
jgi:hypothetical protein